MEDTRLSISERVDTLVSCVTLAFVIAFVEGQIHAKKHPIALKKHGYMLKSYFRNGFDRLRRLLSVSYSKAVKRLKTLLHPPESFGLSIPYQINQFFCHVV